MTIKGTYDTGKASIFSSRPSKSQATDKKVLFGLSRKGGKKGGRESTEALTQIGQVTSMVQTAPEVNGERAPQKRRQSTIIVDETEEEVSVIVVGGDSSPSFRGELLCFG